MLLRIKPYLFLVTLCLSVHQLGAKDQIKYPVAQIPVELTDNANAVIRNDETFVEVLSPSKIIIHRTFAVTILKESALSNSVLNISYGKFNKVSDIEAVVYNSAGEKVKKIKNEDILDLSAIDEGTIYSDYRRKYIDPEYEIYPFTIEYQFVITHNSAFFLPSWSAFAGYNISVERSAFSVEASEGYGLKFRERKITQEKVAANTPGKKTYTWSVSKFRARSAEPFSPDEDELFPSVRVAPAEFEMDGYQGTMNTWKDFGQFISGLNEKRTILPKETCQAIKDLTKDCTDDHQRVQRIYEYAQKKNRYVSIQVGIGGWQTIDAETVDRLSYGDCKALSNYTKSLLEAAGIKAICALVGAGEHVPFIEQDFPVNSFNHMILCVPLKLDSVWLECTSPTYPGGYLGSFTDDRFALLIDGTESKLVRTPSFKRDENTITTLGKIILQPEGNATATFTQNYCGSFYGDFLRQRLRDEKDVRNAVIEQIEIPNFKLTSYTIRSNQGKPSYDLYLNLDLINYTTLMGNRMILKLNQFNPMTEIPRFVRKREFNLEIKRDRVENDTVTYQLPDGYQVEALPQPIEISTEFGSFKCSAIHNDRSVQLIRHMEIYKGVKAAEKYNEFREFLEKIAASDNSKCVLVKI